MNTVHLKISASGDTLLAHPGAKPGPDHLVYAIHGVPDGVAPAAVARQVSRIALAHAYADVAAWSYDWADLAGLPAGRIVNRYRKTGP